MLLLGIWERRDERELGVFRWESLGFVVRLVYGIEEGRMGNTLEAG